MFFETLASARNWLLSHGWKHTTGAMSMKGEPILVFTKETADDIFTAEITKSTPNVFLNGREYYFIVIE